MKIKVKPEDFIVKEFADFKLKPDGKNFLYLLEKTNWNTLDAIRLIAKKNQVNPSKINYCGKKDRYAKTIQYVTCGQRLKNENINENIKISLLGRTDNLASPAKITKNQFIIKIRDINLNKIEELKYRIREVEQCGFPNYFGDQRFGSYDKNLGFFAEKFLKAQYNGALKSLLCSIHSEDDKATKDRKRLFFEKWGDFKSLKDYAKTRLERDIFQILSAKPKAFLEAVHSYPIEEISMAFSAYQSYLWNNMLAKVIEDFGFNKKIPIKGWQYPIYINISKEKLSLLKKIIIPTPGIKPVFYDEYIEKVYDAVIKEEKLYQARFSLRKYRKVIIKSFPRSALVIPEGLTILKEEKDDIYRDKVAITISFSLPKGSYATVLIKSLEVIDNLP